MVSEWFVGIWVGVFFWNT